jgi:ribonuclease HI
MKSNLIFTDGACSGNPGPGGWAAVVVTPAGDVKEIGGFEAATTNNRMELLATVEALITLKKSKGEVYVFTDSTYVIRGITQWIWGWRKNGWKNGEGGDVSHKDLWEELSSVIAKRGAEDKVHWHYSRGHVGTPGNERCDEIAVAFSQKKWVDLYQGPLIKYGIAIYDLPEDTTLPEMKERKEKVPAYSYLSVVNGVLEVHADWKSCEARVKGRSGAKFKKAMSASDEAKIKKEWGF